MVWDWFCYFNRLVPIKYSPPATRHIYPNSY